MKNAKPPVLPPRLEQVQPFSPGPRKRSFGDRVLRFFGWCFVILIVMPLVLVFVVGWFSSEAVRAKQSTTSPHVSGVTPDRPTDPETARQLNQQRWISDLVDEIRATQGADRESKLKELLAMDPDTKEFPEEISRIREARQRLQSAVENFIATGVQKKVPYDQWSLFGAPNTLSGTDNKYWVAYLPTADVSFVSEKGSDTVIFVGHGKNSAPAYLKSKHEAREAFISAAFSGWDGSHQGLTKVIKESMNDPKSYEHVETVYWDMGDHLVVRTTFRGRNAFGGTVKNWVKAKTDLKGNVLGIVEQGP